MSEVIQIDLGMAINTFLIKGEQYVLVDTGNPGHDEKILEKLAELGVNPEDIALIIITHGHSDHFGSVGRMKELTGAPVAIHKSDAEYMRLGKNAGIIPRTFLGKLLSPIEGIAEKMMSKSEPLEPDIIIEGEMGLDEYGIDGRIIPTPGHTSGSVSIYLSSGEVIIGDLVMGMIRKSKPGLPMFADDMDEVMSSISTILKLSPKIIYATHGGPFSPESVENLRVRYNQRK